MEDALISPAGFMILSGAGLIEASTKETIKVHTTEQTENVIINEGAVSVIVTEKPYIGSENSIEDYIYVMKLDNGEVVSEPYIPSHEKIDPVVFNPVSSAWEKTEDESSAEGYQINLIKNENASRPVRASGDDLSIFKPGDVVLVDYYVEKQSGAQQIEITADKFGGNYYLEASTLFRDTNGVDMPAEFIIPNCKIQSNFTFTMASSGDPSSFTFTMDAFPDYTRFNKTKKVLAAIQIIDAANDETVAVRTHTVHDAAHEKFFED